MFISTYNQSFFSLLYSEEKHSMYHWAYLNLTFCQKVKISPLISYLLWWNMKSIIFVESYNFLTSSGHKRADILLAWQFQVYNQLNLGLQGNVFRLSTDNINKEPEKKTNAHHMNNYSATAISLAQSYHQFLTNLR